MKTILVILFVGFGTAFIIEWKVSSIKIKAQNKVIDSLFLVTAGDSAFIHDVVNLTSDGKHDQVRGVIDLNRKTFKHWDMVPGYKSEE